MLEDVILKGTFFGEVRINCGLAGTPAHHLGLPFGTAGGVPLQGPAVAPRLL